MSEKPKARVEFSGLAPGESPVVTITIPLDDEHAKLAELVLERLKPAGVRPSPEFGLGSAPIAPLTTRGQGGDDH